MQKFLKAAAIATAMALVATAAFAEITIGGWGRIDFVSVSSTGADGADLQSKMAPGWGGKGRVGFKVLGDSDNIGFAAHLTLDPTGSIGFGDESKVYLKFNDMIKLTYGRAIEDALRGKLGGYTLISSREEDHLFRRFYPGAGVILGLTPVEGLFFGAALNMESLTTTEDVFKAIQIGAGYEIEGIGFVRAQYMGEGFGQVNFATGPQAMQVAFQLKAVEGLNADVGAQIILDESAQSTVDLGATYAMDALNLYFRTGMGFGNDEDFSISQATLSVAYALDFATLGFEIGAYNLLVEDGMSLQFAPYIRKGYGNGYFRAGFKGTLPLAEDSDFAWEIPLRIEYWF